MIKVVLDTNVVISGLLIPGSPPAKILDLWADSQVSVVISPPLVEEYLEVILRPKFAGLGMVHERQGLIEGLIDQQSSVLVVPEVTFHAVTTDPDDNLVLDCAVQGKTDFIVSGDSHLLELRELKGIPVVSPHELLDRLGNG